MTEIFEVCVGTDCMVVEVGTPFLEAHSMQTVPSEGTEISIMKNKSFE